MPNFAAGIGPGIQAFFQMQQYMQQEHAARQAERAKGLAAQTGIASMPPGAAGPAGPAAHQSPMAALAGLIASGAGGQAPPQDTGNAPDPASMVQMPGGPAPLASQPAAAPGGGLDLKAMIAGLHSMGAAQPMPGSPQAPPPSAPSAGGAPPVAPQGQPAAQPPMQPQEPPPPPPPVGTGTAQGGQQLVPGSKEQFYSLMREVAKSAPKGTSPQLIFDATMQMIPGIKGMEPETKAMLQQSATDARTIAQLQSQLAHYTSNEKIGAGHDTTKVTTQGMKDETDVTTTGMKDDSAERRAKMMSDAQIAGRKIVGEYMLKNTNLHNQGNATVAGIRGQRPVGAGKNSGGQDNRAVAGIGQKAYDTVMAQTGDIEASTAARTEAIKVARAQMGASDAPAGGGRYGGGSGKPKPSASDLAYLKAHPEFRGQFVAHFGSAP